MKHAKLATLSLFVSSVLLSGCTAPATAADAKKEKPKAAKQETSQEEGVTYSSVGSWIPRKVKKKEDVIGTNSQSVEGEALTSINQRNSTKGTREGMLTTGAGVPPGK